MAASQRVDAPIVQETHRFGITGPDGTAIAAVEVEPRLGLHIVQNLWVHHEYRRRGYGTAVMGAAVFRYQRSLLLLMALGYADRPLSDHELIRFYLRFGFLPVKEAPGAMIRRPGSVSAPPPV